MATKEVEYDAPELHTPELHTPEEYLGYFHQKAEYYIKSLALQMISGFKEHKATDRATTDSFTLPFFELLKLVPEKYDETSEIKNLSDFRKKQKEIRDNIFEKLELRSNLKNRFETMYFPVPLVGGKSKKSRKSRKQRKSRKSRKQRKSRRF